ncbi:MAG: phosphatidate cytidylyltransferase [Steroidobacteraceae bacterium]
MLKQRIITALILALCLLGVLFVLPPSVGLLIWGVVITLGAWEWAALGGLRGAGARLAYAMCVAVMLWGVWLWGADAHQRVLIYIGACLWWCIAFLWLVFAPEFRRPLLVLACGVLVLVPCFVAIADVQSTVNAAVGGPEGVLWLLAWVFSADIGAYFAGRAFGRSKLAPRISPGKTWEGVIGGVLLAVVLGAVGARWFGVPVLPAVSFGIALIAVSIVGDLTESMFKRGAGLKDSGALLPGHGGVLDRIDSVTAAAPLFALALHAYGGLS